MMSLKASRKSPAVLPLTRNALVVMGAISSLFTSSCVGKLQDMENKEGASSPSGESSIYDKFNHYINGDGKITLFIEDDIFVIYNKNLNKTTKVLLNDRDSGFSEYNAALSNDGRLAAVVVTPKSTAPEEKRVRPYIAFYDGKYNTVKKIEINTTSIQHLKFSQDGAYLYYTRSIENVSGPGVKEYMYSDFAYIARIDTNLFSEEVFGNALFTLPELVNLKSGALYVRARGVYPDLTSDEKGGLPNNGATYREGIALKKYLYSNYKRPTEVEPENNVMAAYSLNEYLYNLNIKAFVGGGKSAISLANFKDIFYGDINNIFNLNNMEMFSSPENYQKYSRMRIKYSGEGDYSFIIDSNNKESYWCKIYGRCLPFPGNGYGYNLSPSGNILEVIVPGKGYCIIYFGENISNCVWKKYSTEVSGIASESILLK